MHDQSSLKTRLRDNICEFPKFPSLLYCMYYTSVCLPRTCTIKHHDLNKQTTKQKQCVCLSVTPFRENAQWPRKNPTHNYNYIHRIQSRWLRPLPKCAYRWRRLFEFWHPKRAWRPSPLLLWAAPSMPECVANVFQGCAIYAGGKGKGERERKRRKGAGKGKGKGERGQGRGKKGTGERERDRELDFSSGNHNCGLRHLYRLPLRSICPFSFLLSLLLALSLYKWNASVTYRWRNPQSWFHEEKSCSLSLSLSPFSFPSSFHCPFPFLLFPSPFPRPFPFLLSPFPLSAFCFRFLSPFPFPFSFPFPLSPFLFSFSPFSFLLQLDGTVPGGCAIYLET